MILLFCLLFLTAIAYGGVQVIEKTLPNGVKLLVKETSGKGIVSGVLFFRGGKHGEVRKGETSLLFTLLLKGSERFPSSYEISLPFERFGGYVYSSSGDDFSEIGFSTKVEGLKEALEVLGDILTSPLLREEDIERERRNAIVALRSKRERGMEFAMENLRKLTYRGTPYETSALGTEEDLSALRREDLIRRMGEVIRGGNLVVSVVGDFRAEEILPLLEKTFGSLPKGKLEIGEGRFPLRESRTVKVRREGTQTTILCAFDAPGRRSRDYFTFKVLNSALGDGMTSKLFRVLREKKGYAYATYSFYPTRFMAPRLFAYVGTSPDKGDSALKDLLKLVRNPELDEKDVEIARRKIIGDFLLDHQTRLKQAWYLGFYEVMGLGWRMDSEYPERIKDVTLEEVRRAVDRYIKKHHCVVVHP